KILHNETEDVKEETRLNGPEHSSTFNFDLFTSSSSLLKTFVGHTDCVYSIDCARFGDAPLFCSGSFDKTICVWNVETSDCVRLFKGHSSAVFCVKFSPYHYCNNYCIGICSSSGDKTIRFWDITHNMQLQTFSGHASGVYGIEFSPFNGGRYLCSGSRDKTIRLWDVETSESLHVFNGHEDIVWCVDISPLQSNSNENDNNNKRNRIGVIGGNGYTICSGSFDTTIRIWDIETTKPLIVFKGHEQAVMSVKYGPTESGVIGSANTILSGSQDRSMRLWDIRSGQQIRVFNRHTSYVTAAEYSPLVVNNAEADCSNIICSGSWDNTICFWDIRSNKELRVIKGNGENDDGILCLKFLKSKQGEKNSQNTKDSCCGFSLYYGSGNGSVHVWE
ncbi:G-protein beta WD-40 repeats containing protein, partial [Reticulomyxa filosa]